MHGPVPKYVGLGFQGHQHSNATLPNSFVKDDCSPKVSEQHQERLQAHRSCRACDPLGRLQNTSRHPRPKARQQVLKQTRVQGRSQDTNVLPLACCKTGAGGWSPGTNCINPGWEAQEKPVQQPGKGAKGAGVRQGQGLAGDEHHSASHSMERQKKKKRLAIYKLFYHISRGSL